MKPKVASFLILLFSFAIPTQATLTIQSIGNLVRWQKAEFVVNGVPKVQNPFDGDQILVDAVLKSPSGVLQTIPGFWFQDYAQSWTSGYHLTAKGIPQWRLRYLPAEAGAYQVALTVWIKGSLYDRGTATIGIADSTPAGPVGFVRRAPGNLSFQTSHSDPLPLIGTDVCWFDSGGTADYDRWFGKMAAEGENFARVWMCPWSFGIEDFPATLTQYSLDQAWNLDYVLKLAESKGIYIQLCLDYNGMFQVLPDYWGGNNYWPKNPYNIANGGMCANQDQFFTLASARRAYEKRLRYLIARYGYCSHLLAWEFFNELDNAYLYLNPTDVANWYGTVGAWLKANDPYKHLVTTSYVDTNRPEVWSLPQIDIVEVHPYGWADPAASIPALANTYRSQYGKPVLSAEFGTDWHGWTTATVDPYLRGFREGIWGAAVGGAAGTAMSWWWENLYSENLHPIYGVVKQVLGPTTWEQGNWMPFSYPAVNESNALGNPIAGGKPFTVQIPLDSGWGDVSPGTLCVASPADGTRGPGFLNAFVQGSWHPDLVRPFRLSAWFGNSAVVTLHLNSVSIGAVVQVLVDGAQVFQQSYPSKDGKSEVDEDYNIDIAVPVAGGKHLVEVKNTGQDWFFLDWVNLTNVLPAIYLAAPEAVGSQLDTQALAYLVSPEASFPTGALTKLLPVYSVLKLRLQNMPAGTYKATWFNPSYGTTVGTTTGSTSGGALALPVPAFNVDLVARVQRS